MAYADLVLEGVAPAKQSVYSILLHIAERLRDPARETEVRTAIRGWRGQLEETGAV